MATQSEYRFTLNELKIFSAMLLFSFLWIHFAVPFIGTLDFINTLNPILQFIIKEIGFLIAITYGLALILRLLYSLKFDTRKALEVGITGWAGYTFVVGLWKPPFSVSNSGELLVPMNNFLTINIDQVLYYVVYSLFPDAKDIIIPFSNNSLLWLIIYWIIPLLMLVMAMAFLKERIFKRWSRLDGVKRAK